MKPLKSTFLTLILTSFYISSYSQPRVLVEWTDDNGIHICDQSDATCNCVTTLPIAFGEQEVLFEKQYSINISNSGGGNLVIEEPNIISSSSNWVIDYSTLTFPVILNSAASPFVITATFLPETTSSTGPDNVSITMHTFAEVLSCFDDADLSTPTELDLGLNLTGSVKKTVINYDLVLDRSGSMNYLEDDGMGNTKRRIDMLSEAALFFLGLEQLRVQDLPNFEGDSIAITKYNATVDPSYLPLSAVTADLLTLTAEPLVDATAATDNTLIGPTGGTATGNAVIDAINIHFPEEAPTPRKKVLILFSDGFENVGPLVGDPAVTNLLAARQDVNIYSIGMGAANMTSLEQYSSLSGLATPQFFYIDPTTPDPLALNSFFLKIYQNAIGMQSIIDPTYYVNLSDSITTTVADAMISSSDRKVLISVTHPNDIRDWARLEIIRPSGTVLTDGLAGGVDTKLVEGRNYLIYELTLVDEPENADFVGTWTLQATGALTVNDEAPDLSNVPVSFAVSALSGLSMEVEANVQSNEPGEELVVTTEIEDTTTPDDDDIVVESIDVTVTRPDGKDFTCPAEKDKLGSYVVSYPHTQKKGVYSVYVKATIVNANGDRTTRDALKQVVVSNQKSFVSEQKPDPTIDWIKTSLIIAIILLILILILLLRKKK